MRWKTFRTAHPLNTCFSLLLPAFVWNLLFAAQLPELYSKLEPVPTWLLWSEQAMRFIAFGGACFMPIVHEQWFAPGPWHAALRTHQTGPLLAFGASTALYFAAWLPLILVPASQWSVSTLGILAPAFMPILFLLSLAWIGRSWPFVGLSIAFVAVHVSATYFKVSAG